MINQIYVNQAYVVQSLPSKEEESVIEDSFRVIKINDESATCIVECLVNGELTNQYRWKTYLENRAICIPMGYKEKK